MRITIAYLTARENPKLEWLLYSLDRDTKHGDEIDLIFVDFWGRPAQTLGVTPRPWLANIINSPPKPTIWQGPHRITKSDWWAKANSCNTALVLCETDFVVFVDDRCRPDAGWLSAIRACEHSRQSVLAGPYDKHVDDGTVRGTMVVDHRRRFAPSGRNNCGGAWLFGGNFALPLAWALEVNGFEEGCDPVGGEDYIFGQMLCNRGRRIDFDVNMSIDQDRRLGDDHPFPRKDKGVSPNDKSHAMNNRFDIRMRTELTPDLVELRAAYRQNGYVSFKVPDPKATYLDWYDDSNIADYV